MNGYCNTLFLKWSTEPDSNWRFYGFAIRCIGPLCHLCMNTLVEDSGVEPLTEACKATVFPTIPIPHNRIRFLTLLYQLSYPSTKCTNHNVFLCCEHSDYHVYPLTSFEWCMSVHLVEGDGIEPPTRGFQCFLCC